MTKSTKLLLPILALTLVASSIGAAYADNETMQMPTFGNRAEMQAHHEQMQAAFESGDYETVAAAHLEKTGEELTEVQFTAMQKAHELMEEARKIMEDAGLKGPGPMGRMGGKGGHFGRGFKVSNI